MDRTMKLQTASGWNLNVRDKQQMSSYLERLFGMRIRTLLFPPASRHFTGQRWLNIGLRTLHLIGIAGLGGAFLYQADRALWQPYLLLTLLSGTGLVMLEIWSNGIWLLQLRGLATLLKLLILALTLVIGLKAWLLITLIVIASLFAHAPANVRYWSPFYWRRI